MSGSNLMFAMFCKLGRRRKQGVGSAAKCLEFVGIGLREIMRAVQQFSIAETC